MLPEEQKGCRKRSRGTNDLLYIDKAVSLEKEFSNSIDNSWTKEYLDLSGVAQNIKTFLVNSMEKWREIMCAGS